MDIIQLAIKRSEVLILWIPGVTRNEEIINSYDKLDKQRLIFENKFHYLKASSKKIIITFLTEYNKGS